MKKQFGFMRRGCLAWALLGALAAMPASVSAEEYPARPVRIIVGFAPGSATDLAARAIAEQLGRATSARFVVENRPGAGSIPAIQALKGSPADGYTLMLSAGSALVQNPGVRSDLPYDPLTDLTPIARVFKLHGVLVANPNLPVNNLAELIEYARKNPNSLNYGSSGVGMANHLGMEVLLGKTGAKMTHVPYKGDNQVALDLVAGRVDVAMQTLSTAMPLIAAGKQRPLAVLSMKRVALAPALPGLSETGVEGLELLDPFTFVGLVGPAGMPEDRVQKISRWVQEGLRDSSLTAKLNEMGYEPSPMESAEFRRYIALELQRWKAMGKSLRLF